MQHVIPTNDFCFRIGQQRKCVTEFLRPPPIDLGRINADANYANAARIKVNKPLLETPQLGVAERSPKAAIKNEHNSARTRKQITEAYGLSILIQQ